MVVPDVRTCALVREFLVQPVGPFLFQIQIDDVVESCVLFLVTGGGSFDPSRDQIR